MSNLIVISKFYLKLGYIFFRETTEINLVTKPQLINEHLDQRSLMYEEGPQGNTREIVDRIREINDAISRNKPNKRPQLNWNTQPQTGGGYIMDKDVLEKLQQIIASGKLHSNNPNHQLDNSEYYSTDLRNSRQISPLMQGSQGFPMMPGPYLINMPMLVMPTDANLMGYNNMPSQQQLSSFTRQSPQSPPSLFGGQIPWPFASWFPILIRDPLVSMLGGGGWNSFFQTGQDADVCRRQKSNEIEDAISQRKLSDENDIDNELFQDQNKHPKTRQGRAIQKRTVSHQTDIQEVNDNTKIKTIFEEAANKKEKKSKITKTTPKVPVRRMQPTKDTKTVDSDEENLRFGFLFPKPTIPGPGFYINKMKVRRGGVAIAGPGGVATAGRGGTAIVGPGGLAYTQPGGLAVAGPHARVVALSHDADLLSVISRLQEQHGSVSRSLQAIPEGKVVAIGPVIYYHPNP